MIYYDRGFTCVGEFDNVRCVGRMGIFVECFMKF